MAQPALIAIQRYPVPLPFTCALLPTVNPVEVSDSIRFVTRLVAPVRAFEASPAMEPVRAMAICVVSALTITRSGWNPVAMARPFALSPVYDPVAMRCMLKQLAAWNELPELLAVAT